MKLPALTAEFNIGPASGTYVAAMEDNGSVAPAARWTLRPQMIEEFDILRAVASDSGLSKGLPRDFRPPNAASP